MHRGKRAIVFEKESRYQSILLPRLPSASNAEGLGAIPGQGTKSPHGAANK